MSVEHAKQFIRKLRTENELRQQFELVWQGKRRAPHIELQRAGAPIVPRLLSESVPDN